MRDSFSEGLVYYGRTSLVVLGAIVLTVVLNLV